MIMLYVSMILLIVYPIIIVWACVYKNGKQKKVDENHLVSDEMILAVRLGVNASASTIESALNYCRHATNRTGVYHYVEILSEEELRRKEEKLTKRIAEKMKN